VKRNFVSQYQIFVNWIMIGPLVVSPEIYTTHLNFEIVIDFPQKRQLYDETDDKV
jgi:hypothetical protein